MFDNFKISKDIYSFAFLITISIFSCNQKPMKETSTKSIDTLPLVSVRPFGKMEEGKAVSLFTMRNRRGVEMSVINYGGIIVSLKVPDKNGVFEDVTLGYDSLIHYVKSNPFFGALIGRYGNRIAKGKFTLDGEQYMLPVNNGANHLHGGPQGFDKVYWNIQDVSDSSQAMLKLTYQSKDGEQGYPGNLDVEVLYTLTDDNEIKIQYQATTDKKTIVNLTQHAYFNLSGHDSPSILGHHLTINADSFLPVDETLIPTGILQPVQGTPFDFLSAKTIGSRISEKNNQLKYGKGYDHCWALNNKGNFEKIATLSDSISGRMMEIFTDQPGLQFYSGNFLDGSNVGKSGTVYKFRQGLCLETQHFPDAPNKPSFASVTLSPGETYKTVTVYKFSLVK
jgi:aldose 1-epimerase